MANAADELAEGAPSVLTIPMTIALWAGGFALLLLLAGAWWWWTQADQDPDSEYLGGEFRALLRRVRGEPPQMMCGRLELVDDHLHVRYLNAAAEMQKLSLAWADPGSPTEQCWRKACLHSWESGDVVTFEVEHPHPEGPRWFSTTLKVLGNQAGKQRGFLFFASDISAERRQRLELESRCRQAEDTLAQFREEAAQWRSMLHLQSAALEATVDAIIITDAAGVIEWANPAFTRLTGYDREEAVGCTPGDLVKSGHHDAEFYRDMWRTILDGRVWCGDMINRRQDGSQFHENQTITPVFDESGKVRHFVSIKWDVTEQRAAQGELDRHRQHLEALVAERTRALNAAVERARLIADSCADGILGIDEAGVCTFANPAACRMLGYHQDQLVGSHVHALVHHSRPDGSPYPVEECPAEAAIRTGIPCALEDEMYWHADGHGIPVFYAAHPMILDGVTLGAVVSFMDISARKQAELEREQVRQEALRLAKVRAEFLANMSHEIRTPLNGIIGLAQIGHRNSQGRDTQETYARILASGRLLLGIINDVLDFSKIEAGKLKVELMPVNLSGLFEDVCEMVRPQALEKKITLRLDNDGTLPASGFTDPLRLSQILINLLSNAIKFTEQGSVTLRVRGDGDHLRVEVIDTGIGMTEAQQGRLFNPFEQGDGSITRRYGGTGLGLAITRNLVELLEGTITVVSAPEAGSTFSLDLPLTVIPADSAETVSASPPGTPRLEGLHILVAEDNDINQLVIEELLTQEGAHVTLAANGQQAVDLAAAADVQSYDVVLMDVMMPVMDGYEATRLIRRAVPDLPVIDQTAHVLDEERNLCLAAGMVAQITKPVDPEELVAVILEHVANGH